MSLRSCCKLSAVAGEHTDPRPTPVAEENLLQYQQRYPDIFILLLIHPILPSLNAGPRNRAWEATSYEQGARLCQGSAFWNWPCLILLDTHRFICRTFCGLLKHAPRDFSMTVFDLDNLPEYEDSSSTEPVFQSKLPRTEPQITLIDTHTAMADLVEMIQDLPTSPPSLYIDLEGENLGRNGTLAIMQLHILPTHHTYLIDVQRLQHAAFTTSAHSTVITLKSILEWPGIPKVFFDVRHDSDALYHLYGISLEGIKDLQLMEHATNPHKPYLNGLAKCIRRDANLTTSQLETAEAVKRAGRESFCPELGGSYAAFLERPIPEHVLQYCAQDAYILPLLYERYNALMKSSQFCAGLQETVVKYERKRVEDSQSERFESWGKDYFTVAPRGSEWVHPGLDDDACGAWGKPPTAESSITTVGRVEHDGEDSRPSNH
ncbi:ribonuclease H-like domain-containing protein [Triangularia verruculosa]|uniref:Ribonuclease H-like domain-containing protein n=1 Tax=Triangularia verruculosa TaxID=2587418 RepID=A0AAN6XQD7_9PEZI|nr:ribonuclease H-like domain-containing protein [Triangularia verruculosa]